MNTKTKKIVLTALFAALAFVATYIVRIPIPATGGYVNLGDCIVLLGGFMLGPVYGAIAGGIGSALCDLLAGYMTYVPITLVIKALMALAAGFFYKSAAKKNTVTALIASVIGEVIMVGGYFLAEALILGLGLGAAAGILGNVFQGVMGIIAAMILFPILKKIMKGNSI